MLHHYKDSFQHWPQLWHITMTTLSTYTFPSITHHLVYMCKLPVCLWLESRWGKRCRTRDRQGINATVSNSHANFERL